MTQNLRDKTVSNLAWRFAERSGAQVVKFVVSIIIANILVTPVYAETVAIIYIFTSIMQVFVDSGLGTSLVQKKDADDTDFSTVFFFNMGMCAVLYVVMFLCAPLIAQIYSNNELIWPIRVLSLTLVVSGLKNVQQAYVSKKMQFKRFFYSTLGGTVISAVIGIVMAYKGFGVWALIGQDLSNQVISTLVLWFTVRWRPKLKFSFVRLKGLFSYGSKLLASSLIDKLYLELRQIIIGVKYSGEGALAIYNKGRQFPELAVTNINSSIDSVLLPVLASVQDDKERVKAMTRRSITVSSFVIMPILFGMCAVAKPLISFILPPDWSSCADFLMVFSISFALHPIHTANLNAIKAIGRSDLFLKLEIAKKVVGLITIFATMWISPFAMAVSMLVSTVINSFINAYPNRKLLNYGYFEQIKDLLPTIALSTVMCLACMSITLLGLADWLTLIIQVPLGVVIYVVGAKLFKLEMFDYTLEIIKKFLKHE